jgi:hypothetical protein
MRETNKPTRKKRNSIRTKKGGEERKKERKRKNDVNMEGKNQRNKETIN